MWAKYVRTKANNYLSHGSSNHPAPVVTHWRATGLEGSYILILLKVIKEKQVLSLIYS
jgi:hypothetical protein